MPDYRNAPLLRYLDDAAAATPTPGGGSVAAMAGALASTMASMAAGFTAGKERFAAVQGEIEASLADLADARERLLDLAEEDVEAYAAVMAAWKLPKATDEDRARRSVAVREATERSLGVVEAVLGECCRVVGIARILADIANPNLASDVGVAAELGLGAGRAAMVNLEVNLAGYDPAGGEAYRARAQRSLEEAERLADEARGIVLERIRQA